jgi:hypothetical protein
MKAKLSFQAIAVALLLLLAVVPIMAAYGQANLDPSSKELEKLRLRAQVLQGTLNKALDTPCIPDSLRGEVKALASMNTSTLSEDDLRKFIAEAEALLTEVRGYLSRCNVILHQEDIALSLLRRAEERLNMTLARVNMTRDEAERVKELLKERTRGNMTVRDVAQLMKKVREMLRHRWAARLSDEMINYTENMRVSGAIFGLMNALNASSKVLAVLERVRERLIEVNASERAVEAIDHNIERIAAAREVLRQLIERMAAGHPPGRITPPGPPGNVTPGNITRERSRELESAARERAIKMINECIDRLQELRDKALKMNLTDLAREINATITSLRALRDRVASGELNLKELTDTIASAKGVIKHAEESIEKVAIPHKGGRK